MTLSLAALIAGGVLLLAGAVRESAALATAGLAVMLWTLLLTGLRHPGPWTAQFLP